MGKLHVGLACYFLHKGDVISVRGAGGVLSSGRGFFRWAPEKNMEKWENAILSSNFFYKIEKIENFGKLV